MNLLLHTEHPCALRCGHTYYPPFQTGISGTEQWKLFWEKTAMEMSSPEAGFGFLGKLCACHRAVPAFQDLVSSEEHKVSLSSIFSWRRCRFSCPSLCEINALGCPSPSFSPLAGAASPCSSAQALAQLLFHSMAGPWAGKDPSEMSLKTKTSSSF